MSDADATAEPTVTVEKITITKSYEIDEFPVPAVAFRLRSEREDEAMVRVVDPVPDNVPPEDLGFHPDYGSDHWSVEDGNAVFERRLSPGEEYQTVYGIRTTDHDPEQFMTDPALDVQGLGDDTASEDATETDDATAASGRDSSQAARDVISGEGGVAGLDDEDDTVEEVDISGTESTETAETTDTSTASETTSPDEIERESETSESDAGTTFPAGGVGAALAAELREGDLSEGDRELLIEELTEDDAGSEVRLTHLQSRISDLEAYTDALEEFIDEHGSARQLIEDMTGQLESIEEELADLDNRTSENEDDIESLGGHTEENASDIDALDNGIADVQSEVGETQESVEDLRADIENIQNWRTRITTVLSDAPPEGMSDTNDTDES